MIDSAGTLGFVVSFAVALFVGAFYFIHGIVAKKPKLIVGGHSSTGGSQQNRQYLTMTILNNPMYLFGIRLKRETAECVTARLFDPQQDRFVGPPLRWRQSGTHELLDQIDIPVSDQAGLVAFAVDKKERAYYPYAPKTFGDNIDKSGDVFHNQEKDFVVHLTDNIRRCTKIWITARMTETSFNATAKKTLDTRLRLFRKAFRLIRDALDFR